MEGKNQSAGSSFSDLFGAKESPPASSAGIFATMFPPPSSTVAGKNQPSSDQVTGSWQKHSSRNHQLWNTKQGAPARSGEGTNRSITNKNRNANFQEEERVDPCHLSSSLYYGGQDIYSHSSGSQTPGSYPMFKQDGGEDDTNGNNSQSASRGNWWQGSLYY